ncbi:MAG: M55 family metallopeptidase [Thermomicrobiales bacterium]|nr:M55 family metallopeptidase [Thermomicrobiales bacterium]
MRVVISADMEGTCGVVSWVQVTPPEGANGDPVNSVEYERTRARMTAEVNAAIAGAIAGGATEVIVNDSHDGMRNLLPDALDPRARLITGNDKPLSMAQGVDLAEVGCFFYTGYHAKAGSPAAPLAHTWTGWLNDVRFDGLSTGEFGINAAVAGHFGVPVTLVAGDDQAVAQTQTLLGDQVQGAVVKQGLSTFAALHLHPARARDLIQSAAEEAVRRASAARPYLLPKGCRVELEFDHQARADQAILIPGIERAGARTVAWTPTDGRELMRTFRAAVKAAAIRMSP